MSPADLTILRVRRHSVFIDYRSCFLMALEALPSARSGHPLRAVEGSECWGHQSTSEIHPEYNDWSSAKLKKRLKDHNINVPETYSQAQHNWDYASSWTSEQYASGKSRLRTCARVLFDAWDESRLREFLLEQAVVSPSGPREQLHRRLRRLHAPDDQEHLELRGPGDAQAARQMDDSKDYVYSTWDDNRLRTYLVERGTLAKDVADKKRSELLALIRDVYARVTTPVWEACANVSSRTMSTLVKLLEDDYANAQDTLWAAWSDSQIRDWLVEHSETTVPAKLVKLMQKKYNEAAGLSASYLTWPDARLRAYLRNHGLDESALPTSRPGLCTQTIFEKIREYVHSGVEATEETLSRLMEMIM
ncbi:hypothetical protein K438DRAFT_2017872, partial [Mycena galopus ATCC 62051]